MRDDSVKPRRKISAVALERPVAEGVAVRAAFLRHIAEQQVSAGFALPAGVPGGAKERSRGRAKR